MGRIRLAAVVCRFVRRIPSQSLLSELQRSALSVTVRTTLSGAPEGISASISSVTATVEPTRPNRWAMTSTVQLTCRIDRALCARVRHAARAGQTADVCRARAGAGGPARDPRAEADRGGGAPDESVAAAVEIG